MTPATQTITIPIPKNEWLTSNDRYTRYPKAGRVKALRDRAKMLARNHLRPVNGPVHLAVEAHYRTGRGLDDDNCQPTVKALKDGLTDAGIWADDDGKHIVATTYLRSRRDPTLPVGWHAIRLIITDQTIPWMEGGAA